MEKTIFDYLEVLLPIHNCVVIPELGGFIINIEDSVSNDEGKLIPPKYNIVFNPALNYNDGILASYIIKDDNISYNAACNKIKKAVRLLKLDLKTRGNVQFGNIGSLTFNSSGIITFYPNNTNTHPGLYGLYATNIQRIEDINKAFHIERRKLSLRYIATGIAAATIAIFLFMAPKTDIKDSNKTNVQEAGFISTITRPTTAFDIDSTKNSNADIKYISNKTTDIAPSEKQVITDSEISANYTYYIIVAGEETMHRAYNLLDKVRAAGFPQAALVESSDRIRIYVNSFQDKAQADAYLDSFRKKNPQYTTAWVYSKKN